MVARGHLQRLPPTKGKNVSYYKVELHFKEIQIFQDEQDFNSEYV